MKWLITDKGDPDALALVDGYALEPWTPVPADWAADEWHGVRHNEFGVLVGRRFRPHYSRQQPGTRSFCRNGQNLVFITEDARAVWVTFRPTPGVATRMDGRDVWECALFRNEGPHLSSILIREAVALSWALWGVPPPAGIVTFVKPDRVASGLPGYCYRRAGWRRVGRSSDGKPLFRAPRLLEVPDWRAWSFRGERGGKLRRALDAPPLLRWAMLRGAA